MNNKPTVRGGAWLVCLLAALRLGAPEAAFAQAVAVTVKLETNQIAIGQSTVLHVFAQIVPAQRATSDRIFSWYVDLLDANGTVAKVNSSGLVRSASDQDPRTSSSGTMDGPDLRGIHDTFLNLAGAGKDAPVELFFLPIQGVSAGSTVFTLQAGTSVPGLSADFIVAPAGGGDPLLGGDYSAAKVTLKVGSAGAAGPLLSIRTAPSADGKSVQATLTFSVAAGTNYVVEFSDTVGAGASWQALPGAPHNSGTVTDTSSAPRRFYRLRVGG